MSLQELAAREEEITANRRLYIEALRTNPHDLTQRHDGSITDKEERFVCAIGLGCRTFNIPMWIEYEHDEDEYDPSVDGPYARFGAAIGIDVHDMDVIWRWNDTDMFSFSVIADLCEKWWFGVSND